jgi:hypothetical protein
VKPRATRGVYIAVANFFWSRPMHQSQRFLLEPLELRRMLDSSGVSMYSPPDAWFTNELATPQFVGSFIVSEGANPADFSVTIDWGDGNVSDGFALQGWFGLFDVWAGHQYEGTGERNISVTIQRTGDDACAVMTAGKITVFDHGFLFCPGVIMEAQPVAAPEAPGIADGEEDGSPLGEGEDEEAIAAAPAPEPRKLAPWTTIASEVFNSDRTFKDRDAGASDDLTLPT